MDIEETLNISALGNGVAPANDFNEDSKEDSQTMEIEGTLASLIDNAGPSAGFKDDSQTMEVEDTVASLQIRAHEKNDRPDMSFKQSRQSLPGTSKLNVKQKSLSRQSLPSFSKINATQESNLNYSTLTMTIDNNLEALVGGSYQSQEPEEFAGISEPSQTIPLDANLEQLVGNTGSVGSEGDNNGSIQFSKLAGEDDDVSELGMNTSNTSQELSNNSDVQASLDAISEDEPFEPVEPVDLKWEEILEFGEDDMELNSREDVMLNCLEAASKNTFSSIKNETEDVLAQVCSDIESQISFISLEDEFASALHRNKDAMQVLQRKIRTKDEHTCHQVNKLLDAVHISTLSEWDSWLDQVANLYNDSLYNTVAGELEKDSDMILGNTSDINYKREQIALPMLLRSASRARMRNYKQQQHDITQLDDEVAQLEAELKMAEQKLDELTDRNNAVEEISKSAEVCNNRSADVKRNRRDADSAFYKFFSSEKLHNWIITSSNDSYISLAFIGSSSETNLHLSFWITESSNTAFDCKIGPLPRSVNSLLKRQQVRYHPAVCNFLSSKMMTLCQDLKEKTRINSASKIAPMIQSIEHRVARIEHAAKEFDTILSQCKNSILQPSNITKDGFDFHAYIPGTSRPGSRIQVTLTLSECYPFAPIGVRLHSTDTTLDTESLTRQLQKIIKPGFGALSKAMDAINSLLN
jgi:cell division septum initiation protein DivIVA